MFCFMCVCVQKKSPKPLVFLFCLKKKITLKELKENAIIPKILLSNHDMKFNSPKKKTNNPDNDT